MVLPNWLPQCQAGVNIAFTSRLPSSSRYNGSPLSAACLLFRSTNAGLFDYGPPGCSLKENVLAYWRQHFVLEDNMLQVRM